MQNRMGSIVFVGVICGIFSSLTVEAQITETVQKLLPATVAVELKSEQQPATLRAAKQAPKVEAERRDPMAYDPSAANGPYKTTPQFKAVPRETIPHVETVPQFKVAPPAKTMPQAVVQPKQVYPVHREVDAVSYATGTVVSTDGLIVTMLGSDQGTLKVTLKDGQELPAKFVAIDRRSGLQLLKVDFNDLSSVELSAGDVLLGEQVATVLCTDVSDRAAATGIITAKNDSAGGRFSVELMETDVQIGPMSAGAPLANLRGELIGIFVANKQETANRSFAVPSKYVRELLDSQKGNEPVVLQRGYLGVSLNDEDEAVEAPYVTEVREDSPAEKAGFKVGDAIVKIDGEATSAPKRVVQIIGRHKAGEQVKITSVRDGATRETDVTLGGFPEPNVSGADTSTDEQPRIRVVHPGQVIVQGEDGKWGVLDNSGKILHEWELTLPRQVNPSVPERQQIGLEAALEVYDRALKFQNQLSLEGSTIRVERSDVEKQLGELTERVKSLQAEVEKLTEELKNVGKQLSDK